MEDMLRQTDATTWHDTTRSQLTQGTWVVEAHGLITDGAALAKGAPVLITNYGIVAAAVINDVELPAAPVTPVAASIWARAQGRDGLLRRVMFAGEALRVLGSGRCIVPLASSFGEELLANSGLDLLQTLSLMLPGSATH